MMQIPPDRAWLARLERATRAGGPTAAEGTNDPQLVKAADDVFTKATKIADQLGVAPGDIADRLWSSRGRDGIPGLADRIVSEGTNPAAVAQIRDASLEDLAALIDNLAVHMLAREGKDEELHRLLDLKVVADSGSRLITAYNQRIRSSLSHQRPATPIDPKLATALRAIVDAVTQRYVGALGNEVTERAREGAVAASQKLWDWGGRIAKGAYGATMGESKIAAHVKSAVAGIKSVFASALPDAVIETLQRAKDGAASVVDAISEIDRVDSEREVAARFTAALPAVSETMDNKADAVAVGLLKETAALVTGSSGHEVVYVRETGELHINELSGVGGRIGVGGTMRAFTRNAYGDVANTPEETRRSGYELGAVCAHVGAYGGRKEGEPRGWQSTFSLGFNASIPLLSDQSIFDVKAKRVRTIQLLPQEVAQIEAKLERPSETAQAWHTKMREATT